MFWFHHSECALVALLAACAQHDRQVVLLSDLSTPMAYGL